LKETGSATGRKGDRTNRGPSPERAKTTWKEKKNPRKKGQHQELRKGAGPSKHVCKENQTVPGEPSNTEEASKVFSKGDRKEFTKKVATRTENDGKGLALRPALLRKKKKWKKKRMYLASGKEERTRRGGLLVRKGRPL